MQQAQPVTFACRAPTLSERKYSQIRKKLLAQVFSMEDNHHHVYVQKVILWTDHKPLVSISQKPLASVFKRLQCLLLQQYECEIYYKPGKEMLLADTLSRAYSEKYERLATGSEVECIHATHFLPVPDQQLKELQRETACDPTLQFLKKAFLDGFPDTREKQPAAIHQYFEIRDDLSVHGGVIFKGKRCIITQILRQKIKQKLHDSHIVSQGCLCRAQETVYWPRHECQNHWLHPEMRRLYVTSEKTDQGTTYLSWAHIKALGESCHWHNSHLMTRIVCAQ